MLKHLAFFLFIPFPTLAVLAVLEATVRLLDLAPAEVEYWRLNPRDIVLKHDRQGFQVSYTNDIKGVRTGSSKKSDITILHLGDSYTYGWGSEDNQSVPHNISEKLDVNVVNLGVPGTNPLNFLRNVVQYGADYEPDIIVVSIYKARNTFYGGTMLEGRSNGAESYINYARSFAIEPDNQPEAEIKQTSLWRSALFRFSWRKLNGIDYQFHDVVWPGPDNTILKPAQTLNFDPLKTDCNFYSIETLIDPLMADPATLPDRIEELEITFKMIEMMKDWASKLDAEFVVLVYPIAVQLPRTNCPDFEELRKTKEMNKHLERLCEAHKLICFDASEYVQSFTEGQRPIKYSYNDGHFTPWLNEIKASFAAEHLAPIVSAVRNQPK